MVALKTVRVIPNANSRAFRTVNVLASGDNRFPTYNRTTLDDRTFETVQDGGGLISGLASCIVPGGTGGGNWLLSGGLWNDTGVWDDAAIWEDVA